MQSKTKRRNGRAAFASLAALLGFGGFVVIADVNGGAAYGDVRTLVGRPYDGDGGAATAALLDFPDDVTSDGNGNIYIADTFDNAIRKAGSNGAITTYAGGAYGNEDGTAAAATFALPRGVAVGSDGAVYVADTGNNAVRKISADGTVSTLVSDGLKGPYGVAVAGSTVFIADTGNNALKSVSTSGGTVTTFTAALNAPRKIAATANGAFVYVADTGSFRVLRITVNTGALDVVAGSGVQGYAESTGAAAQFQNPLGVALSTDEQTLYVSDPDLYLTDRIRAINLATSATSLVAVDTRQEAMIFPAGMTVRNGNLYVAMSGLGTVRAFPLQDPNASSVFAGSDRFGGRDGADPLFGRPHDVAMTPDGSTLYVADNNRIRKVTVATKTATTIIGSIVDNYRDGVPVGAGASNLDEARFSTIAGIVVTSDGKTLYVSDRWNNRIRTVDLTASPVRSSLVTGAGRYNGTPETGNAYQEGARCADGVDRNGTLVLQDGCAYLEHPTGIVLDPTEQYLYVADSGNHRVRKVRVRDGETTLVAGGTQGYADGIGAAAQFSAPWGLALSADGATLSVAEKGNQRIRAVDLATQAVTTLAGAGSAGYRDGIGTQAYFSLPLALKTGADGLLYLTESGSHRIRVIDPATGLTKTVAGSGERGFQDGTASSARFNNLEGIAPDTAHGTLYALDSWNDAIRQVNVLGEAPYADPAPTVTNVTPDSVAAGWATKTGLRVSIKGTGFRHGAKTTFFTYPARKTAVVSSTEIVVTLPLSSMRPGWYDITVTNVDGQFGVLENGLGLRGKGGKVPDEYFSLSASRGFLAFEQSSRLGLQVASANTTGDGKAELVVSQNDAGDGTVKTVEATGTVLASFVPYGRTSSGVRTATCDLDGDGVSEIVTAPGAGKANRIFLYNGSGKKVLRTGGVAVKKAKTAGLHVACADVTGDGTPDILAAPDARSGTVTILQARGKATRTLRPFGKSFRGGLTLAAANVTGDGAAELIVGMASGGGRVRVLSAAGTVLRKITPYGAAFRGGVSVAAGDVTGDGAAELIVAPKRARPPTVLLSTAQGIRIRSFLAYPRTYRGGVSVATGDVNGDGVLDIITAPAGAFTPSVRFFNGLGKTL